ncbi:DUF1289 domain-containing protein [Marimonas arenosa]|uniref:DUF1289 domain-containing protein n=1 Tax=Marimonas arenosa TaxID=1795305 RepID=A0AAE3WAK9_9RHOB|nr:DUF1289 domain-containing protein [Marimonas arenosa]MDQ2089202.1 DUF1289 domain-containing protein [Marimonas arenosa]
MSDDIWKRDEIESPCVKICVLHPEEGLCTGCHRSRDEIALWSRLSPEQRRAIMAELPSRATRLSRRRGGRAARLAR